MVIRSKHLLRRVLENQHKLHALICQTRACSSGAQTQFQTQQYDDEETIKYIPTQPAQYLEPVIHAPDVGHMFSYKDLQVRLAAPHQLQPKPDVLSFGKQFTDHMFKVFHYSRLGGWQKPEIMPLENLAIHPAAKVLHYAVELFEGMKAYRGVDGKIRLFRPELNMIRMNLSAQRSGLPSFPSEDMIKCLARLVAIDSEWVPHEEAASLYIRPTLIGIDPTLGVASSDSALLYTILTPVGSYFSSDALISGGISVMANPKYVRAWPGGVGDRKMGSNYGPTIHVQKEANTKGLEQVLWLYGDDHQVTECGTMNVFVYFINDQGEHELVTPPLSGTILPGVTRASILELAKLWGECKVSESVITMPKIEKLLEQGRLLEVFGCGTAVAVSPIDRINYLDRDLFIPTLLHQNPIHKKIKQTLADIQYGKIKNHPWSYTID